ncbi:hypothetical protein AB0J55_00310 [Amycolatopsis sp. NPDC049688]|uniref:S-methyl thiohydantoin desulfurase domain-containing protein n=1 Tax=Amycolatopsis sp. NPDC049688 TaxID=3154733 RepID=UPI003442E40F
MSGADVKRTAVPRTLSLALTVGRTIREVRAANEDPVARLTVALTETPYHGIDCDPVRPA